MTSTARAYATPVLIIGLTASLALSTALAMTDVASGVDALLVGLTAGTGTLVLAATVRVGRRSDGAGPPTDWLPGGLALLTSSTRAMTEQYPDPDVLTEARRRLHLLAMDFEQLAQGRIARPPGDYELLLSATHACHRRLEAVTHIPDDPAARRWWTGEPGRRYWAANLAALGRGVGVTRVFVCARLDDELIEMITEQRAAGVVTLVAASEAVEPTLRKGLVIWDGRRAWEARTAGDGHVLTVNDQDLRRLAGVFAGCAAAARPVGD